MPKEEGGSMVDQEELKHKEAEIKSLNERTAIATELIAQMLSGLTTTMVTVKTAIDENTKALIEAREQLNSLVTLIITKETPQLQKTASTQPQPATPSAPKTVAQAPLPVAQPQPQKQESAAPKADMDIRSEFPEELEALLNFDYKEEFVMIKPKQFLGSDNFAKIASTVRGLGGEYISAGRDSHFRVYKK